MIPGGARPGWVLFYEYGERYAINPELVPQVVSVRGWFRWLTLERSKAVRELYEFQKANPGATLTESQADLKLWAMLEDKYL